VTTILTGGLEADLFTATDAGLVLEVNTTYANGSGSLPVGDVPGLSTPVISHEHSTTRIDAGIGLTVLRMPTAAAGELTLTGTWPGQETPLLLASIGGPP
jgi:hypothetical protein